MNKRDRNSDDEEEVVVPERVPEHQPVSRSASAAIGKFSPIRLPLSSPFDRFAASPVGSVMFSRSIAVSSIDVASISTESARSTVVQFSMEFASEQFAIEYAREPLAVLPISCGNVCAAIHVELFASGSRGRCINYGYYWLTPREFEDLVGYFPVKDWKRNIKYAGHDLQILIDANILKLHPIDCSCGVCMSDVPVIDTPSEPLQLTTRSRRDDRGPGPERVSNRPRICPPNIEEWQRANRHLDPFGSNANPRGIQQSAINYSYKDAYYSSYSNNNPSNTRHSFSRQYSTYVEHQYARQYQTNPPALEASPHAPYQIPSTSQQDPLTVYQPQIPYEPASSLPQVSTTIKPPPSATHPNPATSYGTSNQGPDSYQAHVQSSLSGLENSVSISDNDAARYRGTTFDIVVSAGPKAQTPEPQRREPKRHTINIQTGHTYRSASSTITTPLASIGRPTILIPRPVIEADTTTYPRTITSPGTGQVSTGSSDSANNNIVMVRPQAPIPARRGRPRKTCALCRATNYCKRYCLKDGSGRHVANCLHDANVTSVDKGDGLFGMNILADVCEFEQLNMYFDEKY